MTVKLLLDPEQVGVLRELLDSTVRELNYEIANTDNSMYKKGLRQRRTLMRTMLGALGDEGQDGSSSG